MSSLRTIAPGTLLFLVLLPAAASGQASCVGGGGFDYSLAPSLIAGDEDNQALGVKGDVGYCRLGIDSRPRFPRVAYRSFEVDATVPFARVSSPQNLRASAGYGVSISLSERAPLDINADPDEEEPYRFDFGILGHGATLGYESDAGLDEQAVAAGAELRWVNPNWPLLPSTVLTLEGILPTRSEARETLGLDREIHGRVTVRGYWLVPLPARLLLELDAAWFRTFGLDAMLNQQGWDEAPYLAGELGLPIELSAGPLLFRNVFVGYARGQQATESVERAAWSAGVELGRAP